MDRFDKVMKLTRDACLRGEPEPIEPYDQLILQHEITGYLASRVVRLERELELLKVRKELVR